MRSARAEGKRKFGYSRDQRFDCVQVVMALIVTPEGFPLAYQVMPDPTAAKTTLAEFLKTLLPLPWEQVRDSMEVKLLEQAGELYSLAKSAGRAQP